MASLNPEQAKVLLQKNTFNLAERVKNGDTLTPREVAMLESIVEGGEGADQRFVKSQTELADALGLDDRKTIQRWMKLPGHPETRPDGRYDVVAWRQFARDNGKKIDDEDDPDIAREKARNLILQNQKLEFSLKVLRKEYVSAQEVEQWGAHLGGEIRKTIMAMPKLASSLTGLTTAEIEIRLREMADEMLNKLHLLSQRTDDMKEAASEEN